jgi:predicted RNA-binding Zn ribbon-like protein
LEVINVPGDLSLDFANTAEWHAGHDPVESLLSYVDALDWARDRGILDETQRQTLLAKARSDPSREAEAFRRIIALREAVYHIFSAVAHCVAPAQADLDTLNAELAEASPYLRLVAASADGRGCGAPGGEGPGGDTPGFAWVWTEVEDHLTSLLWPVARSATELLTSPQLPRLRECAGEACGWVFLDRTKNASRRWCDMAECGNRAKARRYRARQKGEGA